MEPLGRCPPCVQVAMLPLRGVAQSKLSALLRFSPGVLLKARLGTAGDLSNLVSGSSWLLELS